MKRAAIIVGVLALCLGTGCHERAARTGVDIPLTAEEVSRIERTEDLGRRIYLHDVYAAQATALLLAHGVDLADVSARGWITEGRENGCTVTFVGGDPEQWQSVCVVTFAERTEPNIILVDRDLSETQAAMFNARQLALENVEKSCSDAYNTVVIPRVDGPGWLAYALAATNDPNLIIVGGHYRVTASADGRTVLERRGFTKDCLVLSKRPKDLPPGVEATAYTLGHILDDIPTEVHVFLSLLYGKPLYVMTADRRLWSVEGGKITMLKRS